MALHEEIEDSWQHLGCDSNAVVANANDSILFLLLGDHVDAAPGLGVFHRIADEVHHNLLEAGGVSSYRQILVRQRDRELNATLKREVSRGIDGALNNLRNVERFAVESDLRVCNARDVEKVIDQGSQLIDLA